MLVWLSIVLLGVIEGITEFIPVSSTGHLLIAEHGLRAQGWLTEPMSLLFNVVIQCGAVVAVLPLFPQRCRQAVFGWRDAVTRDYLLKMSLAFVITGAGGLVLTKLHFKLEDKPGPIGLALLVGGVLFLVAERRLSGRQLGEQVTWAMAVVVGVGQLIAAVFPGSSRSGATIILLLLMGLNRAVATEFSFLVGVPTMLCAGGLQIFKVFHHAAESPVSHEPWSQVIVASLVAAAVSFLAVKWLLRFIQTHTFTGFGWYRIAVGLGVLGFLVYFVRG